MDLNPIFDLIIKIINMKKIIPGLLFALMILQSVGCKDSYSCDCTAITKENGVIVASSSSKRALSETMTADQAKASCDVVEKEIEDNFDQQTADPAVRTEAQCTVK
jgi:hypothetical protein